MNDDLPTEHAALVALRELDDQVGRDISELCKSIAELESRLKYAQDIHQRVKEAIDLSVPVQPCPPQARAEREHGFCPDCGAKVYIHNGVVAYCNACTDWMRQHRPQHARQVQFKPEQLVDSPDKAKLLQLPKGPPWPHAWACPKCRKMCPRNSREALFFYGCLSCEWKIPAGEVGDEQLPEPQF